MRISDWSSDVCSSDLETGRSLSARRTQLYSRCPPREGPRHNLGEVVWRDWYRSFQPPRCLRLIDGEARARRLSQEAGAIPRSEEHTSELQSLMRISYAVFCLKKKKKTQISHTCKHSDIEH